MACRRPEPFTNWTASITEDIGVIGGLWLALNHPILFLVALVLFVLLLAWLLPKLWRGIKSVFGAVGRRFGGGRRESEALHEIQDPRNYRGRCGRCEFKFACGGSRARAYAMTGDPLGDDPLCAYQPGTADA